MSIPFKYIRILSTVTFLVIVLFSCKNSIEEVKEIGNMEELPVREVYHVTYLRSVRGNVQHRLFTPLLKEYKNKNIYFPKGFSIQMLDSNLTVTADLQAKYGEILNDEKKMIARDSVIFVNIKGEELFTEELIWQQDSGRIYTNKFVKIKKPEVVILGKGLESNEDFSKYVLKDISGEYYIDDKKYDDEKAK